MSLVLFFISWCTSVNVPFKLQKDLINVSNYVSISLNKRGPILFIFNFAEGLATSMVCGLFLFLLHVQLLL
ncbi:hypothetical protein HEP_00250800 [Hepatocystis sp. ex Piliocolobus tephrosceles]|nr:hypothetical protein HEP_00250800 [Hepatocystis sp. ex Piliocolobus tephrosceles]